MTINEMLVQSALLTGLGMCVVFGFIVILIVCMKLLHVLVHAFKLDKAPEEEKTSVSAQAANDDAVVAAIAVAIKNRGN